MFQFKISFALYFRSFRDLIDRFLFLLVIKIGSRYIFDNSFINLSSMKHNEKLELKVLILYKSISNFYNFVRYHNDNDLQPVGHDSLISL